ncbi:ATP-grasp fold amidoligase family protein [Clostridium sp.]|jgi:hypothetical protein|uniref:ATP-grasp fold amidoligase family protein n=1 Tax=Clostridium sp. TaxID=1506 RepID=UPI003EEB8CB5
MKKIKKILRKFGRFLPTKLVLYIDYGRSYRRILNLKKPIYFGEKIQWIKFNGNLERFGKYVDKYQVRNYVQEQIGNKYLNEVYGVYKYPEEIDFNSLPKKFVIKMTNGTAENIICKDKNKLDIESTIKTLSKWKKEKLYKCTKEMQYKNVESRIMCEEYLEDESGSLKDYKFHCSNGKVHMITVYTDRFIDNKHNYYDFEWGDYGITGMFKKVDYIKKPGNLDEMINISEILSKDFPYVRVDLYSVKGKVYFGELTLTPSNGTRPYYPIEKDIELAKMININDYKVDLPFR